MAKDIPYDQKYYDPEIECMPRPELEALQLERLKDMVAYAYDNTVYYKRAFDEAGVKPGDIESLDDIAKFPFCDKKTERETQHVGSFFGEMCSVPEEEVIFMATSSGSTGVPTVSPFTQEDFDLWQDTEARLFWQAGMRPNDRYVHGLNFALYVGGPDVIGAQRLGALAIWVGAVPSDRLLFVLKQYQPTIIWTSPSYAWHLGEIAKEKGCSFLFEASVGGGIPILRPMSSCLAANELSEIVGILNGTTNYILTRMIRGGLSFDAALKEAQEKGYAEADPTADIEGHDACRKICILSSLGFGRHIYPEQVPTEGITHITLSDVAYARSGGYKIKLLGRSIRRESDGKVCAFVAPHLVHEESPLANVEDVFNAIQVTGDSIGDVMFYGRGAGKLPTASAVVADIMDIVKSKGNKKPLSWGPGGEDTVYSPADLTSRWYFRVAGDFFADGATRLRNGDANDGESAFISDEALTIGQIQDRLKDLDVKALYRALD